jgi:hypothetical protein
MQPQTRQLAINHASADGEARIISDSGGMFLVTPRGDLWQIFDFEGQNGDTHPEPRNSPAVRARIFVGLEANPTVRICRFDAGESRSTVPRHLLEQLERGNREDDRAA